MYLIFNLLYQSSFKKCHRKGLAFKSCKFPCSCSFFWFWYRADKWPLSVLVFACRRCWKEYHCTTRFNSNLPWHRLVAYSQLDPAWPEGIQELANPMAFYLPMYIMNWLWFQNYQESENAAVKIWTVMESRYFLESVWLA